MLYPIFNSEIKLIKNTVGLSIKDCFYIIPGNFGPRWIIPCNPKFGYPVLKKWHPWEISSKMKWFIITTFYRLKILSILPGILTITLPNGLLTKWSEFGVNTNENGYILPSIYIGTQSPTFKIVSLLVESVNFEMLSVLKVPVGNMSFMTIQHEAKILEYVNKLLPNISPKIIFNNQLNFITTQNIIIGNSTSIELTKLHFDFFEKVITSATKTTLRDKGRKLILKLMTTKNVSDSNKKKFVNYLKLLDESLLIPTSVVHGDFTPWNIKQNKIHGIQAFDWENAEIDGLPGLDLIHFLTSVQILLKKKLITKHWFQKTIIPNLKLISCYREASKDVFVSLWQYYAIKYLSAEEVSRESLFAQSLEMSLSD